MGQEGWSNAAFLWCLAKAQGSLALPNARASSATPQRRQRSSIPSRGRPRRLGELRTPDCTCSHAGFHWASATKRLALRLAQVPRGAARPGTVTWPNPQPAPAVLFQLVLGPRGRLGGGAGEGAGLRRGPMATRAGPQGWGQVCGAGPGSGGANERAPRPGPAGARDAAERLVATVTVCKRRGSCEGPGVGVVLLAVWVRPRRTDPGARAAGTEGQSERG